MYIAGFVIPVPEEKMEAYRKWAENGAKLFKEYGCIEIVESWEDNVPSGKYTCPWIIRKSLTQFACNGLNRVFV